MQCLTCVSLRDVCGTVYPFKREADDDVYFVIEVTLDEAEIIGRKPLLPALIEMSDCVDSLITNFKLLLR